MEKKAGKADAEAPLLAAAEAAGPNLPARLVPEAADPIHDVFVWILSGACQHDIEKAIAEQHPRANPRSVMVSAMQRIAESAASDPDVVKGWAIEATRQVYQRALEAGDFASALRSLKQIVELSE